MARLQWGGDRKSDQEINRSLDTPTQQEATDLLGVGVAGVRRMRRVEREAPELVEPIEAPELVEPIKAGKLTAGTALCRKARNRRSGIEHDSGYQGKLPF